jgi:hypothetical protein
MDNDKKELQKMTIFSNGLGTLLYATKQKGLYKPGLMIIMVSLIVNMYIESVNSRNSKNMIPKYIAIIAYLSVIFVIYYYLYHKYEDIIHENNIYGEFKRFSNQITMIFVIVFLMEIYFMLDLMSDKDINFDYVLIYSIIIYCLTLRLSTITADMYLRLKNK